MVYLTYYRGIASQLTQVDLIGLYKMLKHMMISNFPLKSIHCEFLLHE